jgi:hypothetical protein
MFILNKYMREVVDALQDAALMTQFSKNNLFIAVV